LKAHDRGDRRPDHASAFESSTVRRPRRHSGRRRAGWQPEREDLEGIFID
jgi:hypothetical protein